METAIKVLCKELRLVTNENQTLKISMTQIESLSDNHGLEMKRLADNHGLEIKALSDSHGLEIQALTDNHGLEMKASNENHELKSDALTVDHVLKMDELNVSFTQTKKYHEDLIQEMRDKNKTIQGIWNCPVSAAPYP